MAKMNQTRRVPGSENTRKSEHCTKEPWCVSDHIGLSL